MAQVHPLWQRGSSSTGMDAAKKAARKRAKHAKHVEQMCAHLETADMFTDEVVEVGGFQVRELEYLNIDRTRSNIANCAREELARQARLKTLHESRIERPIAIWRSHRYLEYLQHTLGANGADGGQRMGDDSDSDGAAGGANGGGGNHENQDARDNPNARRKRKRNGSAGRSERGGAADMEMGAQEAFELGAAFGLAFLDLLGPDVCKALATAGVELAGTEPVSSRSTSTVAGPGSDEYFTVPFSLIRRVCLEKNSI